MAVSPDARVIAALDVGASFSTVALQATFHSIPIYSTDLRCDTNRHVFLSNILRGIEPFKERYSASGRLPEGFACYPIEPHEWQACLQHGIKQVSERMVQCAADRILTPSGSRAPDRSFSVVFSHHAVPKYSNTESFLKAELPELLRVTDRELRLFPGINVHPNRLEPHKRPFHTIIPAMVTKDGRPWFSFGVMGGDMQPQGHVEVLVNMIDFGMNPQMAGDASRIRHGGSTTPTGIPEEADGGTVYLESGFPAEAVKKLMEMGHKVGKSTGSFGGYQGILIDHEHGTLHGATDPRKDGAVVGY